MKARMRAGVLLAAAILLPAAFAPAQQKMSHDEWQREIEHYTAMRNDETRKLSAADAEIAGLRSQSVKLAGDVDLCTNELYALVGSDAGKAAAYRNEIAEAEQKANELMRLSDADLVSRSGDVKSLGATVKGLWQNKLSLIPEFYDRLTALNDDVARLEKTLGGREKTYTVKSWSSSHDCLWTISSRKSIYGDPWLWPKIWEGNRDHIKDPDLIYPGERLNIPPGAPLTAAERKAEHSYYASRHHTLTRKPLAKK
ncbi:MAG TPA: hypothetical protein VL221_01920 [Bacteroidota bacterium]|nr:hypothetical protein [Bacteroidota bacterium]